MQCGDHHSTVAMCNLPWPPNLEMPLRLQQQVDHRLPLPPCHSCTTELGISERTMIVWKSQKVPLFVCLAFAWNRRFFIDDGPCEFGKREESDTIFGVQPYSFSEVYTVLGCPRKTKVL